MSSHSSLVKFSASDFVQNCYRVMEEFYSIQGEGYFAGKPFYFIRLAGCDVGCSWCDVKESWHLEYPLFDMEKSIVQMKQLGVKQVVITGGEPTLYNLCYLTQRLSESGFRLHLETSGAYPITGKFDWITLSPKKYKNPLPENLPLADELKVIVYNKSDFSWAEDFQEQIRQDCKLYLQPEFSSFEKVVPQIIEYVKKNPQWTISLQTHRILGVQ